MHDFALTENYVVLFDLPVIFSLGLLLAAGEMPYAWIRADRPRGPDAPWAQRG